MQFKLQRDYYGLGYSMFPKSTITLQPGLTVLVGCNGSGKTTLLMQLKEQLNKDKIPYIAYNNLYDGGANARSNALWHNDINFLANTFTASEGEEILMNITRIAKQCGGYVRQNVEKTEPLFVFLDAVDSGLSVENVMEMKEYLFKPMLADVKNKEMYIIVTANGYEMVREVQCFDVMTCKYVTFVDYEDYRKFIIATRKKKDARESKRK